MVVSGVVAEQEDLAIATPTGRQVLLDVLDKLVAVADNEELSLAKMVGLEDRRGCRCGGRGR